MTTVLVDHNIEGQAEILWGSLASDGWLELVPLQLVTLAGVGLPVDSPDRVVWRFAQAEGMLLLTNNCNATALTRWVRPYVRKRRHQRSRCSRSAIFVA